VVPRGSGDTINLLRRTSFGALSGEKLDELLSGFRGFEELGFNLPELYTEIDGPALKLMPVAIFV
jgi:hypothetical protein